MEAYVGIGLVAAILAVMVVEHLDPGAISLTRPSAYFAWVLCSGAAAGVGGFHLVRDRIGRPGARGAAQTFGAALLATFFSGLVGGSLALPIYGTMFGPLSLLVTLVAMPGLAVAWASCFILAHLRIRLWHVERDSIFNYCPRAGQPDVNRPRGSCGSP